MFLFGALQKLFKNPLQRSNSKCLRPYRTENGEKITEKKEINECVRVS